VLAAGNRVFQQNRPTADVDRGRKRGLRSPKQTVKDSGLQPAWQANRTTAGPGTEEALSTYSVEKLSFSTGAKNLPRYGAI